VLSRVLSASQIDVDDRGTFAYNGPADAAGAQGMAEAGIFGDEAWGIDDLRWCMNDPDFANIFSLNMSGLAQ